MEFYSIQHYFVTKVSGNGKFKKEESLFFFKKKRKSYSKEGIVTYDLQIYKYSSFGSLRVAVQAYNFPLAKLPQLSLKRIIFDNPGFIGETSNICVSKQTITYFIQHRPINVQ